MALPELKGMWVWGRLLIGVILFVLAGSTLLGVFGPIGQLVGAGVGLVSYAVLVIRKGDAL